MNIGMLVGWLVGHCSNLNLFGKLMKEQTQMD